jgi:CheY-like chemotaxis protein
MILLVEDNLDHAEIVMRSFKNHQIDHPILHVTDGETALDYLLRRGEYTNPEKSPRPNLVLLDLRLPKVDGLEVLKEIKQSKELRGIPVVILTSSQAGNDVKMACEYHANTYWLGYNVNPTDQGSSS